jgi:error-prone DNA polymerase
MVLVSIPYIELHARSAFSFLRGACVPEEYAEQCAALDQPAMTLVDFDGVYGAPRFHLAMKKKNLTAYLGAEVLCTDGARYPLLIRSRTGYQNLCRMITRMKLRTGKHPKPGQEAAATLDELAEFSEGLICLTGDAEGPLARGLYKGEGRAAVERLQCIFKHENVYLELQRHFDRHEEARNQAVMELARAMRAPLVATNGVCYAQPGERELLDVFTCLRHKTTLTRAGRLLEQNSERFLKSAEEMSQLFNDVPEAIVNTANIAAQLKFTLADLGYQFPHYPVPEGESEASFLRKRTEEGAVFRYGGRYGDRYEKARPQIERELALIEKLGFEGYFLIVWDIVKYCRDQGILVQGRGSAANSAVCYSLRITAVDPVGMDLLFERFLSEQRGEWPDIDLDLPSGDQRERAIQYVYDRYGKLGAAMTANVITYRGRSAAREAGKVLGFDQESIDRLSKLVPVWGWKDASDTPEKQFREAGLDLSDVRVRKFHDLVVGLQDLPRHLGQHSGGMVICQGQLDSVVPLEPAAMPGRVVVQWDKEDCADMGIVKVDLLGLGMMAVLEESVELIRDHYGREIDLGNLPQDDPQVYEALQRADTIGLFQVESRAQMASLPRMRPEKFYDLVVQVAIIRPGPIVGKMAHPYLMRRQGKERPDPLHPLLQPVLERTLGVPLFQEQLLRMAMIAANFTGGEAEELRRAFGFKRSEKRMHDIEGKLRAGMTRNGIVGETQDRIVQSITSFAMYGFPESHAASFALLAYASAYLRTHFMAAFTCALLNNQPMGFYHPATIVKDAQRHGLRVLPVDINLSGVKCGIEGRRGQGPGDRPLAPLRGSGGQESPWQATRSPVSPGPIEPDQGVRRGRGRPPHIHMRLGFRYVRGLRARAAEAIVEAQPIRDIEDLARRVPELDKSELTQLAAIGALNSIGAEHRRDALWKAARAARPVQDLLREVPETLPESGLVEKGQVVEKGEGENGEDENGEDENGDRPLCPLSTSSKDQGIANGDRVVSPLFQESPLRPMTIEERLIADCEGTGMTIGRHPMAYHRAEMNRMGVTAAAGLHSIPNGRAVKVAGHVIVRQRPGTAKGILFMSLEDETGISNVVVMPGVFEQQRVDIVGHPWVMVEGQMQNVDNVIHILARRVLPMPRAMEIGSISHDFH